MSLGRAVEHGTHDELYSQDGMYRGLVDAQRISTDGTADEVETPEETLNEVEIIRSHSADFGTLLRRSPTNKSSVVEAKDIGAGIVDKRKYSLFYLFRKVCSFKLL